MRENRPSRAGVVRAMARSDHWRWVSTPTSGGHTIPEWRLGVALRSVHRKAWGLRMPAGSRTSTHRIGSGGSPPWYQIAVPLVISRRQRLPPYGWRFEQIGVEPQAGDEADM